jgi:predicted transcriptional regulator
MVGLILEAANGGATKTKIMYGAFLSFEQLKQYLAYLLEKGLIDKIKDRLVVIFPNGSKNHVKFDLSETVPIMT